MVGSLQALVAAHATLATLAGTVRDAETGAPLAGAVVVIEQLGRMRPPTAPDGTFWRCFLPDRSSSPHAIADTPSVRSRPDPVRRPAEIDIALPPMVQLLPPLEVVVSASPFSHAFSIQRDRPHAQHFPDPERSDARRPDAFAALHGGAVTLEQETPAGLHVRGGATDQTAYLLDGIPVLSPITQQE
jgi:hypothetical protein